MNEIEALLEKVGGKKPDPAKPAPSFVMPGNKFLVAKKQMKRAGIKKFIKPENALCVRDHLPAPEGETHCLLNGNFILGDMIQHILEGEKCPHLRIATLGLSPHNAQNLANLVTIGTVKKLTIICSHYFEQVNKDSTFKEVSAVLDGLGKIVVTRSHAKCILAPTAHAFYVVEGSANLRSSDNLEQMTIFNSRQVHDWHAQWMDEIAARETHQ